ncbi:hypothetical protein OS493_019244 [Desmophyllum pertusum]|uniref:Gustatory receptor n=1 Tax=Desmophyllum pertusum TaxID=174260 RepID=A0A9W9YBN4_9CNID|nr:hypothetical protein OS493_019244 [Desmophyllum pertusum]
MAALKMEHHKLCEVVEFADKMLAPLIFEMVSLHLPLICLIFYKAVNLPEEGRIVFLVTILVWLVVASSILAIIMIFGSKVCEKIHGLQKILQTLPISKEDEGKLLMFILDLLVDPKGLSIGGLVIIDKSMSLTIVGVLVSYFAVMLSLPK